jgi:hypothetical protein
MLYDFKKSMPTLAEEQFMHNVLTYKLLGCFFSVYIFKKNGVC